MGELAAKMSHLKVVGENLMEEERASFIHDFNFDGGGIDDVDFDVPASRLATRWTGQQNHELFFFVKRERDELFDILREKSGMCFKSRWNNLVQLHSLYNL